MALGPHHQDARFGEIQLCHEIPKQQAIVSLLALKGGKG
jgi:hypothetical protein